MLQALHFFGPSTPPPHPPTNATVTINKRVAFMRRPYTSRHAPANPKKATAAIIKRKYRTHATLRLLKD
jgi:hypothetical protein